jgi:hypothetical protein
MKTFNEILKQYEFTDFEEDEPIVSDMFHKDDVKKAFTEWLIQFRVEAEERFDMYDALIIQDLIDKFQINCVDTIKEGSK